MYGTSGENSEKLYHKIFYIHKNKLPAMFRIHMSIDEEKYCT